MKLKSLATAVAMACVVASGSASAIVVGGVDFGVQGLLQHIDTTTLAETYVDGDNQTLQGYGEITNINGNSFYATANPTDRLYFVFDNYTSQNFTGTSTEFTGGVVDIYYGSFTNLQNQNSAANLALITGTMTPWVRLTGHGNIDLTAAANATIVANGNLLGSGLTFTGSGLLDVDTSGAFGLAAVASFLDGNAEADVVGGFADVTLTTSGSSSNLNPNDTCTFQPGEWCIQGSADMRGDTNVPAPAGLALLGAGLLGFAAAKRRKQA